MKTKAKGIEGVRGGVCKLLKTRGGQIWLLAAVKELRRDIFRANTTDVNILGYGRQGLSLHQRR
jgi:hypothetical protein